MIPREDFRDVNENLTVHEGEEINFTSLDGNKYHGIIEELDCNVAYVRLDNGRMAILEL